MPSGACANIALAQCRFIEIQKVIQMLFDDLDSDWHFHGLVIANSDISEAGHTLESCHQFRFNHTCLPQKPGLTGSQDIQNSDVMAVIVEREGSSSRTAVRMSGSVIMLYPLLFHP
jgi:hypothetical protein